MRLTLTLLACGLLAGCPWPLAPPPPEDMSLLITSCPERTPLTGDSFGDWVLKAQEVGGQYDICRAAALRNKR